MGCASADVEDKGRYIEIMFYSLLTHIEKTLDNVSGLAEQSIEEHVKEYKLEQDEFEVNTKPQNEADNSSEQIGIRKAVALSDLERQQLPDTTSSTLTLTRGQMEGYSEEQEPEPKCEMPELPDEQGVVQEQTFVVVSEKKTSIVDLGKGVEEEFSRRGTLTLHIAGATDTSPDVDMPILTALAPVLGTMVSLPSADHEVSCGEKLRDESPFREAQSGIASGGGVEQLLRFQQMLAQEMEISRLLREDKQRLSHSMMALEEEVSCLRSLKNVVEPGKVAALEREGIELSTQLGKEREKVKLLQEKRTGLENRIISLEEEILQYTLKEGEWRRRAKAYMAESEAVHRETKERNVILCELEGRLKDLEEQLSIAKRQHAEMVAEHQSELSRHRQEMNYQRENTSVVVESLQREKDNLVSTLQRSQMEYERRVQELEERLIQANRHADRAETRLTEHERDALGPLRELRAALNSMEHQKKQLMEDVACAVEECAAQKRNRQLENENFMRRLAEVQAGLQTMQEEKFAAGRESLHWKGRHSHLQKALEGALERASRAEVANDLLRLELEETRLQMESRSKGMSQSPASSLRGTRNTENNNVSLADQSTTAVRLALFHPDCIEMSGDLSRSGRRRVEKELVRQAVEIERLHNVEIEAEETKRKLSALAAQHDLLMQMYGMLQEELQQQQQQQIAHNSR